MPSGRWTERLKAGFGLSRRSKLAGALTGVFARRKLDEAALDVLETALLTGDVGVDATAQLLADLKSRWKSAAKTADPRSELAGAMVDLLRPLEGPLVIGAPRPYVIMLAGVNGAGKTTSIGKLAKWLQARAFRCSSPRATPFARRRASSSRPGANATALPSSAGEAAIPQRSSSMRSRRRSARGIDVVLRIRPGVCRPRLHLMDELRRSSG